MVNNSIRIVGQKEATAFLPGGQTQRVIVTSFYVGQDGPFSVQQPEDGFDPATQRELVLDKAQKLTGVKDHPSFS